MSEPYIGEIRMAGFNFAPVGWAFCNGALLPIAQFSALFALIGTNFGGDGLNTFAVPNLSGRIPLSQGQGPGLSPRTIGESGGSETVALTQAQMPAHTHSLYAAATGTRTSDASAHRLASGEADVYNRDGSALTPLAPTQITTSGAGLPHQNMQPFLAVTFIIALEGIFPSQN